MNNKKNLSWSMANLNNARMGDNRMWPADSLIRATCSSRYFSYPKKLDMNMKILDVGCLYVNNLVPFSDTGVELHGTEINPEMILLAEQNALLWGIDLKVQKGVNKTLPYDNQTFDTLLSLNTIHYERNKKEVLCGLREFHRVGNESCHFYIMTNGKNHLFHKSAVRIKENSYRLRTDEFRNNQTMAYFDDKSHFKETLETVFSHVEVAVLTEQWPTVCYEFYLAKCYK